MRVLLSSQLRQHFQGFIIKLQEPNPLSQMRKNAAEAACRFCSYWVTTISQSGRAGSLSGAGHHLRPASTLLHDETGLNVIELPQLLLCGTAMEDRKTAIDIARFDISGGVRTDQPVARCQLQPNCDYLYSKRGSAVAWPSTTTTQHWKRRSRTSETSID